MRSQAAPLAVNNAGFQGQKGSGLAKESSLDPRLAWSQPCQSGSAVLALYCFAFACKHLTVVSTQNLHKSSRLCRFSTLKGNSLLGVFSLLSWFNIS